jgi:GAF domain-containing protein
MMPAAFRSNDTSDAFARVTAQAREAIHAARDTRESIRTTRRRVRLHSLIMSWRRRQVKQLAVQAERLALTLDVVRDEAVAPMGNIQLFERGALRIRAAAGLSEAFLAHFDQVYASKCACGAAYERGTAVIIDDVRTTPLFEAADRAVLLATGIQACQSLALVRDGHKLGVISLHYRHPGISTRRQVAFKALAPEIAEAVSLAICR